VILSLAPVFSCSKEFLLWLERIAQDGILELKGVLERYHQILLPIFKQK
jgi:hypothetical protein